ncbi:DUF732 domain-containing protein [Mycobacterium sp. 3519A]|jgi:hypothetical protein|uniref:DUF732 domain-containing protein n=1 Tax=Mycobacterium sp. 3519A TaxID=2057184 RepID=UPI000C7E68A4|nr:DUF732 domain-containing protein [Mycobacterium sp. 3519A]
MIRLTTLIGTVAAASALGLAALTSTGVAAASTIDDTFITVITEQGIQPPSTREAVSVAHDACAVLAEGGDLVDAVGAVAEYTELGTEDAAFFVGASIATYCPEHEGLVD